MVTAAVSQPIPFQGPALAMSSAGLAGVATNLGVFAPEVWTVLAVETSGCGFLPDRRPQILYERHIFSRLTGGQFDDGDISAPTAGGYGPGGAHQYDRLEVAIQLNRSAALQSASWGIGQIMGENHQQAGFADVETMVAAMSQSEDNQLAAMGNFIIASRLHLPLRSHDWTGFARGYNGPNFATNHYNTRLNGEFQKFSTGPLPDLMARAVQLYLTYLGYHPGPVDGMTGGLTLSALAQFQAAKSLPVTNVIDANAVAQVQNALPGA